MANMSGPTPGKVVVACSYYTQENLQELLLESRGTEARELSTRLQGVAWLDNIRKALELYAIDPLALRRSNTIQADPDLLYGCREVSEVQSQISFRN